VKYVVCRRVTVTRFERIEVNASGSKSARELVQSGEGRKIGETCEPQQEDIMWCLTKDSLEQQPTTPGGGKGL
jgi:hypothetical protein